MTSYQRLGLLALPSHGQRWRWEVETLHIRIIPGGFYEALDYSQHLDKQESRSDYLVKSSEVTKRCRSVEDCINKLPLCGSGRHHFNAMRRLFTRRVESGTCFFRQYIVLLLRTTIITTSST